MRRHAIILLFLATLVLQVSARAGCLEVGAWPQFGIQMNNPVIIVNDYTGLGMATRLGYEFGKERTFRPVFFGEFSFMSFGTEHWYVPLSAAEDNVLCDVNSQYRITSFCPGFALNMHLGSLRPYGEFFGGPAYFTILNRFDNNRWTGMPLDQTEDFSRLSYIVSMGGGLKFMLWQALGKDSGSTLKDMAIDLKITYQKSGQNEFIVKQNLKRPELHGPVLFEKSNSSLDMVQFRFGASFRML
jgi:hypothetical protein